jgi:hypothetical protein
MEPMDAEPEFGKAYLDELDAVLLEIAALPLVTPPVKLIGEPGDKPTNIKVRANVKAEFVALPKSRQPAVCLSKERPAQLEAARALLEKLRSSDKGGYAEELAAAAAAAAAAADAGSGTRFPCGFLATCLACPAVARATVASRSLFKAQFTVRARRDCPVAVEVMGRGIDSF